MKKTLAIALLLWATLAAAEPLQRYQEHCAACHGPDRLGLTGPALLPESLERLKKPDAAKTIREGRAATQMQGFAEKLAPAEIDALVQWIYTPVEPRPAWSEEQIKASRLAPQAPGSLPNKPAPVLTAST